jgi:HEPN domain-containing protein
MKPLTREWIAKAEADWESARREMRARKAPNYDSACFHAQQCAEKYLKSYLQEISEPPPRTHDIGVLVGLLLGEEPLWSAYRPAWSTLTDYAVRYRYPGETATRSEAKEALALADDVRSRVRSALGLPP